MQRKCRPAARRPSFGLRAYNQAPNYGRMMNTTIQTTTGIMMGAATLGFAYGVTGTLMQGWHP